jgi:hypothetical protein
MFTTHSLKQMAREKRGTGTRPRVLENTKIPTNWQAFLHVDENKTALFNFLADSNLLDFPETDGKTVMETSDDQVRVIVVIVLTRKKFIHVVVRRQTRVSFYFAGMQVNSIVQEWP